MPGKTVAILLAGGIGERFGGSIPKQFISLNGKPIIQYSIEAFQESPLIDYIIIVTHPNWIKYCRRKFDVNKVVRGGKTRNESTYRGLKACPKNTKYVLIHDAVRPYLDSQIIERIVNALEEGYQAVDTIADIHDGLIEIDESDIITRISNRKIAKLSQTPEGFDYDTLLDIYQRRTIDTVDDVSLAHYYGVKSKAVEGVQINTKITYPSDLFIAEQLVKYNFPTIRKPELKNKSILVLGGSGGIGKAIVKELSRLGAEVIAPSHQEVDLNKSKLPRWLSKLRFDCIIHATGIAYTDEDGLIKKFNEMMNVNCRSALLLVNLAVKTMPEGGNIILIGSTAASRGRRGITLYSASKAALNSLVESQSARLAKHNIRINCICPARVNTKLQKKLFSDSKKSEMISTKDIAKIIVGYCDIDTTGQIIYIKKGMEKIF